MESNQDLENFFAQNTKQKKGKAKGKKAKPAPAEQAQPEQSKPEAPAAPEKQAPLPQNEDDASSDEDQIVINEGQQKIKDKKEIEQTSKSQSIENEGWRPGGNFGKSAQQNAADAASKDGAAQASAQGSGPGRKDQGRAGGFNFGGGKFTFTKQSKGGAAIGDAMNFPSLGESSSKQQAQPAQNAASQFGKGQSKASGPMMFTSDNLNQGNQQRKPRDEEVKQAPVRPTFTGKAKMHASNDQAVPASNTNYDFSSMRMSAATSGKRQEGDGGNREDQPRQRRERPAQQNNDAFSGDEDFEVVKEKKKRDVRRGPDRSGGDFGFGQGGGPPRFSRGGEQQ